MSIIGTGILLAIGWYLAPLIISITMVIIGGIGYGICRLFGGCRD